MVRERISPELKNKLLAETIYRCAYCLKNIEKEKFEVAHINPCVGGGDNSYENLIVLCSGTENEKKSGCHWEWDFGREIVPLIKKEQQSVRLTGEEISKKEKWIGLFRKLKDEWMFATGKYSKMELELLLDLHEVRKSISANDTCRYLFMGNDNQPKYMLIGSKKPITEPLKPWLRIDHFEDTNTKKPIGFFVHYEIHNGVACLFRNIIESRFVHFIRNIQTSAPGVTFKEGFLPGRILLTEDGYNFCKKIYDRN